MKRIVVIICLVFCFFLFGCNSTSINNQDNHSESGNNTQVDSKEYVTITFDSDGGSSIESQGVKKGNNATKPNDPTKEGYTFLGWYYDNKEWNFIDDVVTDNITLVAKWQCHFRYEVRNKAVTITSLTNTSSTHIVIPSTIDKKKVTSIGNGAFKNCTSFTTITIPDSVINISDNAFMGCTSLTNITIPNSVTSIGNYAFRDCTSLASIIIPSSVSRIFGCAFMGCTSLTSVTISNGVTQIGPGTFSYCTSLTDITIPNSVTSIEDGLFSYCTSLTNVTIPNSVTIIRYKAFSYCTSLTSVIIPDSVTSIRESAFYKCTSLTSIAIPDSVTSIDFTTFFDCTSLTSIIVDEDNPVYDSRNNCNAIIETSNNLLLTGCSSTKIPNSVTDIGNYAFSNCTSLTSITIPNSVSRIGGSAFMGCIALKRITIPNSVTTIDDCAFFDCTSLTIYCKASSKPSGWHPAWNQSNCPVVWGYTGN